MPEAPVLSGMDIGHRTKARHNGRGFNIEDIRYNGSLITVNFLT